MRYAGKIGNKLASRIPSRLHDTTVRETQTRTLWQLTHTNYSIISRGLLRQDLENDEIWMSPSRRRQIGRQREEERDAERRRNFVATLLQTQKIQSKETCSICLEPLNGEVAMSRNCKHRFHRDCLVEWLVRREDCPVCRRNFLVQEAVEQEEDCANTTIDSSHHDGEVHEVEPRDLEEGQEPEICLEVVHKDEPWDLDGQEPEIGREANLIYR